MCVIGIVDGATNGVGVGTGVGVGVGVTVGVGLGAGVEISFILAAKNTPFVL